MIKRGSFFTFLTRCFCLSFALKLQADIVNPSGTIHFNVDASGSYEASLSSIGLKVGSGAASANLHVDGSGVMSEALSIGQNLSGSNLNLNGALSVLAKVIEGSSVLGADSLVLAQPNSAGANLRLRLPDAGSCTGRIFQIKNLSSSYDVDIFGEIDDESSWKLKGSTINASLKLISNGSQYYIISSMGNISPTTVLPEQLLCWLKFNETSGNTASDSSGQARDGSLQPFTFGSSATTGKMGGALRFDGSSDYLTVAGISNIYQSYGAFTIMTWIKASASIQYICGENTASSQKAWTLSLNSSGEVVYKYGSSYTTITSHTSLTADEWNHLAVVFNHDSGQLKVYINGLESPLSEDIITNNFITGSPAFWIGRDRNGYFTGEMDDFRIYNGAIAQEDIQYAMGAYFWETSPSIVNIIAADPDFGDLTLSTGDTITITFDVATNQPSVGTKDDINALINFGTQDFGSDYQGIWVDAKTLKLTLTGSAGNIAIASTLSILASANLKHEGNGSLASSANGILEGHWGTTAAENLLLWLRLDQPSGSVANDSAIGTNMAPLRSSNFNFSSNAIPGKFNDGLYFNGTSNSIDLDSLNGLGADLDTWTMMGWFKPEPGDQMVFSEDSNSTNKAWRATISSAGNITYAYDSGFTLRQTLNAPIVYGSWNHVAWLVNQAAGVISIVVNGVDQAMDSTTINNYLNGSPDFYLGKNRTTNYYKGGMDDIRIFNRVLTPAEIQAIYLE